MEVSYTIQMAAKISGVGVHTIRAWEKRYQAIVPKRDVTGHRVYSRDDIEKLILLSELCLLGYSISKIANQSPEELKGQLKVLGKSESSIKSLEMNLVDSNPVFEIDYSQSVMIILLALKAYKLDIVSKEIGKIKSLISPKDFALNIILPMLTELSKLVESGEFSVSHEHALSAILKFHIGHVLYKDRENLDREYYTIIFCGIEDDYHEFGILMGALIAVHYQFNVIYLGANLPAQSLIDTAKSLEAKLVVVGATSIVATLSNNHIGNYIAKVGSELNEKTDLAVGSNVAFEVPNILKRKIVQFKSLVEFDNFLANLI